MENSISEKRRRELLSQARRLYSDSYPPPAVHPRYHSVYHKLYEEQEEKEPGTLALRFFLSFMLFAAFVMMDYRGMEVASVSSGQIKEAVEEPASLQDVLAEILPEI